VVSPWRAVLLLLGLSLLLGAGCLPPWPLGEPAPVPLSPPEPSAQDDDDAADDDDDATADDDDDDAVDDDDVTLGTDDDDVTQPDPNDVDGDGYSSSEDCDDGDPAVHPGAPEVPCDGVDNNCDSVSECRPCIDGVAIELGTLGAGFHTADGVLSQDDSIYGQLGSYFFDLYRITAGTVGLYSIGVVSLDFDTFVELYDGSCGHIRSDDDGGVLTDSAINNELFATGEDFYVVVTSASDLETGSYTLSLVVAGR